MKWILGEVGLLWLRLGTGLGMAYHGSGKIFGGRMEGFAEHVGEMGFKLPAFFAWAAALSELGGGLLIAVGLLTRGSAAFVFVTMGVAAFVAHAGDPFGRKELALAYMVMSGALILAGPGRLSLDTFIRLKR